jgi:hypothetical protein
MEVRVLHVAEAKRVKAMAVFLLAVKRAQVEVEVVKRAQVVVEVMKRAQATALPCP